MRLIRDYLLSESRRSVSSRLFFTLLLIAVTAFSSFFSILWPAYWDMKVRDTKTIPWSVRCIMVDSGKDNTVELEKRIAEEQETARVISCLNSDCSIYSQMPAFDAGQDAESIIDAQLFHRDIDGVYPFDIVSAPSSLLEGDPYQFDGTVIDALTAQKRNLHVGDSCYVGLADFAELSGQGESAIKYYEMKVAAVVAPDDNFKGIACFQPEDNEEALLAELGEYATDVYITGLDDDTARECVESLKASFSEQEVQYRFGYEEIQNANDSLRLDEGSGDYARNTMVGALAIVLAVAVLDAVFKIRKRIRTFAIFIACGIRARALVICCFLESAVTFGLVGALGFIIGCIAALTTSGFWIPGSVFAEVGVVIVSAYTIGIIIQTLLLAFNLRQKVLYTVLTSEEG